MAESKGAWFDTKSGKVVSSEPEEGIQLVAPGVEATDAEQARVDAYRDAPAVEQTVTTKTVKGK